MRHVLAFATATLLLLATATPADAAAVGPCVYRGVDLTPIANETLVIRQYSKTERFDNLKNWTLSLCAPTTIDECKGQGTGYIVGWRWFNGKKLCDVGFNKITSPWATNPYGNAEEDLSGSNDTKGDRQMTFQLTCDPSVRLAPQGNVTASLYNGVLWYSMTLATSIIC